MKLNHQSQKFKKNTLNNIAQYNSLGATSQQLTKKRIKSVHWDRSLPKKNKKRTEVSVSRKKKARLFELYSFNETGRSPIFSEVTDTPITNFTGNGILALPNGKKYEGEWVEGTMIGTVKITEQNGEYYIGQVYEYQRHGLGEYHFKDGKYVG